MLRLYWSVGHDILVRQQQEGWGAGVVDQLSQDLQQEFPGQSGFSRTNLHYMNKAAEVWPTEEEFVQHGVEQLPWGHITVLLDRLSTRDDRDWYAARAVAEGWKRNVLEHFIKVGLRQQLGSAKTNFAITLDAPDTELAQQLVKDPYVFEHLAYVDRVDERNVEQALMDRLQDTLPAPCSHRPLTHRNCRPDRPHRRPDQHPRHRRSRLKRGTLAPPDAKAALG